MGILAQLSNWLGLSRKEAQILIIGLDNSEKSTILNYLKPAEYKSTEVVPTVGFNVERVRSKTLTLTAFDMSGQGRYRNLWANYYKETHGVVFVVDNSDRMRMVVAKDELDELLKNPDFAKRKVPLLIFANKMDERHAMSTVEVCNALGLNEIRNKPWQIYQSCALTGEGIADGMEWISAQIKQLLEKK